VSSYKKKKNVGHSRNIRVLSLCTGYGGLEIGLARALDTTLDVIAVEVETYAQAIICKNAVKEAQVVTKALWPDLKTFPSKRFRGCFDFVLAGFPCQPVSVAGRRKGKSDHRWLWDDIARIIETIRSLWVFLENVPGLLSLGYPSVYRSLRLMGYKVEAGLFTAAEVGAPHKRERLFVLAQSRGTEPRGLSGSQRQEGSTIRSTSELAHNPIGRCEDVQIRQARESAFRKSCRGLANTKCPEQGQGTIEEAPPGIGRDRLAIQRWPSRPGQPQYEWEEPRVVDYAQHRRCEPKKGKVQTGRDGPEHTDKGQAQSRLGRAVNGTNCRVDRLRLLGNGVVPQQAELAFRTLMALFDNENFIGKK